MFDAVLDILPLLFIFLLGFGLKQAKMLTSEDGTSLLKLNFYVGGPALIFLAILQVDMDSSVAWLCMLAPAIILITLGVAFLLRRSLLANINVKTFGSLLVGAAVMNPGVLLPFVVQTWGAEGLARLMIIESFNVLFTFSLVYVIAARLGSDNPDASFILKKLLLAIPLWALVAAFICKLAGFTPPALAADTLHTLSQVVVPAILIALGLKFTLKISRPKLLLVPLVLRFGLGAVIGFLFVKLLGLEGLTAQIAMFVSIAPIGFNSITFAELEKLDVEFAASQVSIGLVIALITAPFAIQLLSHL